MDENLQEIENLFYSSLKDDEEMPSKNVWEAVDKRLDKDNIVSIKRKYTYVKRIAIVLLMVVISFTLYELSSKHNYSRLAKEFNATDKPKESNKIFDNSATTLGKPNTGNYKSETPALKNLITVKDTQITYQKEQPINEQYLKKQNSENHIALNYAQKKTNITKADYGIKIKNSKSSEEDQSHLQNDQTFHLNNSLEKQKNVSIENIQLQWKDSNQIKKIFKQVAVIKNKIFGPGTNDNVKNVKRNQVKISPFSLTAFFSPDVAWYHLEDDNVINQSGNATQTENEETHEFSSTTGVLIDYKIYKHWILQSGLTFSDINILVQPKIIYARRDNVGNIKYFISTSSGYGFVLPAFSNNPNIGDSIYAFSSTHNLQYIGIPLSVKYNISKSKLNFNALAGLSVNYLIAGKIETLVAKGTNNEAEVLYNLQGLKKLYFSGMAGVGVSYDLNRKILLTVSPTIRFALNAINKDSPVKSFPNSFGLSTGIKIGL